MREQTARRHGPGARSAASRSRPARSRCSYTYKGEEYELNLIDTPGHVDFHYEVSRSLACCEGAVLLVDAFQGVEAQTVANAYAAMEHDLTIVPVLNKIDLKHARPDEVIAEMEHGAGDRARRSACSAAARRASASRSCWRPSSSAFRRRTGDPDAPLQAMVFDSHYDEYRGAITYVRVMNGTRPQRARRSASCKADTTHEVLELGQFVPAAHGRATSWRPARSAT